MKRVVIGLFATAILATLIFLIARSGNRPAPPPAAEATAAGERDTQSTLNTGPAGTQRQPAVFPVPTDVLAPPWLESRRAQQLQAAGQFEIFHEFRFADRVAESGITFENMVVEDATRDAKPVHYDHGNGIAVADVNGDDALDVYFTTQIGSNELWMNRGNGRFEKGDQPALALNDRISVTASFADVDNDGDSDLYVTTVRGGNVLFVNDGAGGFADATSQSGLGYVGHSSSAVFFDYDRDGLLDLFLCNVGVYTTDERGKGGFYIGVNDAFAGHLKPERSEASRLYRNLGNLRFQDVSLEVGLTEPLWTGDASPVDFNNDGWLDLYVLNMQGNDAHYENIEGKRFESTGRRLFPKTPWGSMGVKSFDFENDGDLDLLITDMHSDMSEQIGSEREKLKARMQYPESFLQTAGASIFGNAFFRNRGDGSFDEVSDEIGAENYWPWGVSVGDINADGYDDAFITAGMNYPYRYGINTLLLNDRGRGFLDSEFILGVEPRRDGRTAKAWFDLDCADADRHHSACELYGITEHVVVWGSLGSRASVLFDLDDDGDLDIVTNEFNDGPMVLISNLSERSAVRFLKVGLAGTKSNRSGLGARVQVHAGDKTWLKVNDGKSGYLSQSACPLYFGLDQATVVDSIKVEWPGGTQQEVAGPIETNRLLTITEP